MFNVKPYLLAVHVQKSEQNSMTWLASEITIQEIDDDKDLKKYESLFVVTLLFYCSLLF